MKFATRKISKGVVLGLALMVSLLVSASAFASAKGSLQLTNTVTVNGTTLKAGEYKVVWEGNGPNVEVSILLGRNVMAKVPAHVVELPNVAANDAALTHPNASGPNTLAGIRFGGKKFELDLGGSADGMVEGSSK